MRKLWKEILKWAMSPIAAYAERFLVFWANSAGLCTQFKVDILAGVHNLNSNTMKLALFLATASRAPSDATYSTTGELAASGNYTQGGKTLTNGTAAADGTTAHWTPGASVTWTALTSSGAFDCAVMYNSSVSDKQVSVHTFASQSISAADFTLTMPTDDGSTGLIRIA